MGEGSEACCVPGCPYRGVSWVVQALLVADERWFLDEKGSVGTVGSFAEPEGFSQAAPGLLGRPGQDAGALGGSIPRCEGLLADVGESCAGGMGWRSPQGFGASRELCVPFDPGAFGWPPSPHGSGFAAGSGGFVFSPCKRILAGRAPPGRCAVVGEVSRADRDAPRRKLGRAFGRWLSLRGAGASALRCRKKADGAARTGLGGEEKVRAAARSDRQAEEFGYPLPQVGFFGGECSRAEVADVPFVLLAVVVVLAMPAIAMVAYCLTRRW